MTCIAYKDGVLAADTKISGDLDGHVGDTGKIKKVGGYLIGAAGDLDLMCWFLQRFDPKFMEGKVNLTFPTGVPINNTDFAGIVITPKGKIYEISSRLVPMLLSCKYIAIGSGESAALGAMYAGADAKTAVKAAIKHTGTCGGRIQTLSLGKK